jgi:hypothetical protein
MACDSRLVDPRLVQSGAVSAKREAFLDLVRELVAEGRRALVFSQFVELLTLWRRDLDAEKIPYEYLDGRTTKRDVVVARFQEGTAPLFLISLKAGGATPSSTATRGGTRRSRTRRPIVPTGSVRTSPSRSCDSWRAARSRRRSSI